MYCPNCGSKNPDSANFCRSCGTAMGQPIMTQGVIPPANNQGFPPGQYAQNPNQNTGANYPQDPYQQNPYQQDVYRQDTYSQGATPQGAYPQGTTPQNAPTQSQVKKPVPVRMIIIIAAAAVVVLAFVIFILVRFVGCSGSEAVYVPAVSQEVTDATQPNDPQDSEASSPDLGTPSEPKTPTIAKNENGVWTADAWKDIYPHQYETFSDNELNSTKGSTDPYFASREDMVKLYPQIKTIWNPSPFNTYYNEPNGHPYALEDVRATGRIFDAATQTYKPTAFANCYTCKSADYTALLAKDGNAVVSIPFGDAALNKKINEPISCYNCHANNLETDATSTSLEVTQPFFTAGKTVDIASQTCGQCHNEYYFSVADKSVTNPYSSTKDMTPQDMYEYYKTAGKDGDRFNDYINPLTKVGQLKAQHPEFEFVFGGSGSSMAKRTNPNTGELFGCADCHMGEKQIADDGIEYTSHLLISPLDNPDLLESTCEIAGCHTDLQAQVEAWQKESEDRVMEIGNKIEDLTKKLADAVAADSLDSKQLSEVRTLNRQAVWYWDFVMVENSEGAHNPTLSNDTLDLAEEAVDKALGYF